MAIGALLCGRAFAKKADEVAGGLHRTLRNGILFRGS